MPDAHPLALGGSTRSRSKMFAEYMNRADLVCAIGSSLTKTSFGPPVPRGKKIIHSTNDAGDINKDYRADHALVGDATLVIDALIEEVGRQKKGGSGNALTVLKDEIAEIKKAWKAEWKKHFESDEVPINQYRVIGELLKQVDRDNAIVTHDSGSPREQTLPWWETTKAGSYMGWGKSTQLGYGLGITLGAKLASPDKLCMNIMGDCSFGMTGMDIETASRNGIAILTVVFNNGVMACERAVMETSTAQVWGALGRRQLFQGRGRAERALAAGGQARRHCRCGQGGARYHVGRQAVPARDRRQGRLRLFALPVTRPARERPGRPIPSTEPQRGASMYRSILCGLALALAALPASAADFYKGKTVTVITSTGVGGSYDRIARTIARHMPKHLAGTPVMIVQNMPGGGNVLATNYMYNVAPKDGTAIATINNAIPLHQVADGRGVRFDARKFNWLGSTGNSNSITIARSDAGVKSIQDVMKKEVILGGTGPASSIVIFPAVMNHLLDTKFKIVTGYKSSSAVDIAFERGEVQARSGSYGSLVSQHSDWIRDKKIVFLVQVGGKREKTLPGVPLLTELARNDDERRVLKLISSPIALGRPYLAPPGLPAERVAELRTAFAATMKDKGFLAEIDKQHLDLDPMTADEVAEIVNDTINAPPALVAKAKAAMPQKKKKKKKSKKKKKE